MRTIHSPFGQVLKAIRENEARATSLGYDADALQAARFRAVGCAVGLAGSTKVLVLGFETLTNVHWSMSGLVILMTLMGGLGTIPGPILGALVIIALENKLGDMGMFLAADQYRVVQRRRRSGHDGYRPHLHHLRDGVPARDRR